MKNYIAKAKAQKMLKDHSGPIMLNVGCGTDYKDGWVNIDNNSDNNIEKLDLNWDLMKPLPFADNSADFIFNEHFFEHFTVEEAQKIMKDLYRVLKPGGVMRIAVPDLDIVVDRYLSLPVEKDPTIKAFHLEFVKTKAEWINMSFRWWGHKWLYNWEELERRLHEAGCEHVTRCKLHKSTHAALRNLETRDDSLVVEVKK